MNKLKLTILFLFMSLAASAQRLAVESLKLRPNDLSARNVKNQRHDLNGKPCALLKVMVLDDITKCSSGNIGDIVTEGPVKLIYITSATPSIELSFKYHYPLTINFTDYGYKHLEGNSTYELNLVDALQMMMGNGNSQNANTAQQTSTATTTQNVEDGKRTEVGATGTNWSEYENKKLSLFKYGKYKDGKELNSFFGSEEYMLLQNGILKWNGRQDGDTKYNYRVSGNVIYITPKGKAPSYVKWIRIERRDADVIFTYDNLGTYRYLSFATTIPYGRVVNGRSLRTDATGTN